VLRTTNGGASFTSLGSFTTSTIAAGVGSMPNSAFKTSGGTYGWINSAGSAASMITTSAFSSFTASNTVSTIAANGGYWNGSGYVTGRTAGTVNNTTDFTNWTTNTAITSFNFKNATWASFGGVNNWMIVGQSTALNGPISYYTGSSLNGSGSSWTAAATTPMAVTVTGAYPYSVVSYASNSIQKFVAVGGNTTTNASAWYTSNGGDTWTSVNIGTVGGYLRSVDTDGTTVVAVGQNGIIYTAPVSNLSTWTARTSGTSNSLYCVKYSGGTWIAVGDTGTVLTSTSPTSSWTLTTSVGHSDTVLNNIIVG
jgi:hypothetical protein